MTMKRLWTIATVAAVVAVGAVGFGDTTKTKADGNGGSFSYSVDDGEIGGRLVYVDLAVNPTWPPSDRKSIWFSGYACTIAFCDWGFCYCDYPYDIQFSGYGEFPAEAFVIGPRGETSLVLDPEQITDGAVEGECDAVEVAWTPSGEFHMSQHGQFAVTSPTEVTRGVSHQDDWHSTVAGTVCGVEVEAPASGYVQRNEYLNVVRELK